MGLLFELGPCTIANEGENTTVNDHGWNTYSNLLFLDQPADVGYSYSSGGVPVDNSPVAAEDVYAFLQLFLSRYPEYESAPFHVAGESYGGTYVPHIVSEIHRRNKKLDVSDGGSPSTLRKDLKKIHLESVILANGLTDPYVQFGKIPEYACEGPYALFKRGSPECDSLREKARTCQRLIQNCYDFQSRLTCLPPTHYCTNQLFEPFSSQCQSIAYVNLL
ncbi:hypothetical protein PHLCEN_2v12081 [Hermanssonia centrifuga]|uniref:Carboxypeptidase n=1 Tax=Hermanssonia centrifuga TaxID=98765 RepID=A0A2R6NIC5_9APHY|nr:hypothetical protein PHLCEN_2v12081 [Hermanssonia centrifuga]